ncbi:TPA: DNA mismatch repair endonuclease MutL [Klebsiella quasipneumoniae]|uniref:DNA mismatch repair endonuclease MutL n=1 Tax=Klebsiella quasipneumoniae TaxID=1463165 RepID=UPI000D3AD23A|nr:DNA mismatch repair endonuclease MutL [Klebsiella quasipneumoniae]AWB62486.1 DNA mismatch repair endonuclease MutL [Enterobacteriaceae bacterium S05]HCM6318880.1 DNA mismatch repair endonuclease MutL [Klebsiella quasipneumoniae subsp. similipneumoniae]MBF2764963.1 DNA mismatch repair endonuclease MutL [Klebsiella quasipneumoniae]MCZ9527942.1 DNA mismatch repair endonuclease MutL [Klebsiella quasipneumoniae]MDG0656538.1 DNA mismatch repair endonuclease MutL [Klebsiella quasipneumoniae]
MPIQVLPPQLANQIAAGEVVERPASVVKELVENSLDAGATRIDIDIERGGAKLIRIRDNGCGIKKDELALALARHATSKIASLDDLEAIISLGFRGEALASISSVARLTLTSRTAEQQEAWQAYAEGRDQAVTVKPAAHPVGTTLEVLDLFYNTPARRKFMRTEKTEFGHIDEVVRRIALARFDVTINLSHNGKVMRQYRAVAQDGQRERRLGTICGAGFLEHALAIEWQHGDLTLRGWVADPLHTTPALAEIQYCYVNGRMMRDRLINHAIRQACEDKLGADQQPAFVLYLEIDPHQVDVNVHPAKHEVRFHQSRLVHDFIYQGVLSVLQQQLDAPLAEKDDPPAPRAMPENRIAAGGNQFARPSEAREPATRFSITPSRESAASSGRPGGASWPHAQPGYQKQQGALYRQLLDTPTAPKPALQTPGAAELAGHSQSFGRVLTIVSRDCALLEREGGLALLSLTVAERWLRQAQLTPGAEAVCAQPLLIPLRLKVTEGEKQALVAAQSALTQLGIDMHTDALHVTVRAVPLPLRQQNLQILIPELIGYLAQQNAFDVGNIAQWMARNLTSEQTSWNMAQAIALLADVERLCPQLVRTPPGGLLQPVDLHSAMNALKDE